MKIYPPIFLTNEVVLFLAKEYPYASSCFSRDMLSSGEEVSALIVEKWFRRYFPSELAYKLFRQLELEVTQYIHL